MEKMSFDIGLYYKNATIVNDDSSIVSKGSLKLIDDPRVIIYDHNKFIIKATGVSIIKLFFPPNAEK
jgi:hypothetical protein